MRIYYYKPYEKLSSISLNNVISFHIITLNFIINILFARNSYTRKTYNIILIITDKIINHATYITIIINLKVDEFINIL